MRYGVLGDSAMACEGEEIPLGGQEHSIELVLSELSARTTQGMNEHAIYEVVGAKQQRPSVAGLAKQWCPEIVVLMEQMWAHDHKDRPDMAYVVEQLEVLKDAHPPPRMQAKAR
jgi:hypothetical protein